MRNAIDQATIDELHALCAELEAEPRILIITGAGGVFASGADIAELRERGAAEARAGINAHAFIRIHELPMPVIAAVDGWALGGGAELAYAADIRIATPAARFGNPETGLGIIAAAGGDAGACPRSSAAARAAELLLTGRILDADEALADRAGLVDPSRRGPARRRPRDRRPDRRERPARDPADQGGVRGTARRSTPPSTSTRRPSSSTARRSGARMTEFLERKKR